MTVEKPLRILLIEDNHLDVKAALRAAKKLSMENTIHVVHDADSALDYLHAALREDEPNADLVLLDLDLPGKDGREVLALMKADEQLRNIPVIVLTTSDDEADVDSTNDLAADGYVTKPVSLEAWIPVIEQIETFWLGTERRSS